MPKPAPIDLVFQMERPTKNKVRFREDVKDKEEPVIEILYVSKARLKKMGDPETLHVHIEAP